MRGSIRARRDRARWPAALVALLAAALLGLTACSRASGQADDPPPAAAEPGEIVRRVAVLGDSVALTLRPALRGALHEFDAADGTRRRLVTGAALGFGLGADRPSRYRGELLPPLHPGYVDRWRTFLADERPDDVVLMVGTWDAVPRRVGGRWLAPDTAAWERWYARRVERAVTVLTGTGARLTWLVEPCVANRYGPEPANAVAERVLATEHPDVAVVDLDDLLCRDGEPVSRLRAPDGALVRVRRSDGVHFAPAGTAALAPALADALRAAWAG